MKRTLLISPAFPPVFAPESIVAYKAARKLIRDDGISLQVLSCAFPQAYSNDNALWLQDELDDNMQMNCISIGSGKISAKLFQFFENYSTQIPFVDTIRVEKHLFEPARKIIESEHIERIFLRAFPLSSVLLARRLKACYPHLYVSINISDPLVTESFYNRSGRRRSYLVELYRSCLGSLDEITVPSSLMLGLPEFKGFDIRVVPHLSEEKMYRVVDKTYEFLSPEHYSIVHLGALYGQRCPTSFLEYLKKNRDELLKAKRRFVFVGSVDSNYHKLLNDAYPETAFVPPLNYYASLDVMRKADCLLLLEPDDANVYLPSKTMDYLGSANRIMIRRSDSESYRIINEARSIDVSGEYDTFARA